MHAHRSDSCGRRRDCCLGRSVATSSSAALPTASDRRQRLEIATGSKLGLPARQRRTAGDLAAFARLGLSKGLPDLQLRLAPSKKTGVRLAEVVARVRLART